MTDPETEVALAEIRREHERIAQAERHADELDEQRRRHAFEREQRRQEMIRNRPPLPERIQAIIDRHRGRTPIPPRDS